jgi:Phytanoyl-CoA dioxygenase (PhyH)
MGSFDNNANSGKSGERFMRDLSQIHLPIGSLFACDGAAADDVLMLSDEQVQFFRDNGYVAGVRVLDDGQVEALCAELEAWFDPDHEGRELWYEYHTNESADPNQVLFHALGAWRIGEAFHDVLWNRAFTVPASQLLAVVGDEETVAKSVSPHPDPLPKGWRESRVPVRFWHDQLFCKPARHGGVVAWHQDYSYWTRTVPMQHLTCWIGLDESTIDNGCLHYVPGSHKWNLLPITGLAGDMEAIRQVLDDEQWEQFQNPAAIELKPGECAFHHPLMVHGSYANRTDRPRRACVLNVVADGVRSETSEPLLEGITPIPPGEPLQGQFFPLLYTPDDGRGGDPQRRKGAGH